MRYLNNINTLIILFFLPLLFWVNLEFHLEFLSFSLLIFFSTYLLTKNDPLVTQYKNIAHIIYSIFVLIICSQAIDSGGNLMTEYLVGDSFYYIKESVEFSKLSFSLNDFRDNSILNYYLYQGLLSIPLKLLSYEHLSACMVSVFISLLCLILVGKIASLINVDPAYKRMCLIIYIIFPHILATSVSVQKEIILLLLFLLVIYNSLLVAKQQGNKFYEFCIILLCITICFFLRLQFVFVYFVTFFILSTIYKSNKIFNSSYFIIIIALLIISSLDQFNTLYELNELNVVDGFNHIQSRLSSDVYGSGVTNLLAAGYSDFSFFKKIVFLPVVTLVQFLNPINVWDLSHLSFWFYLDVNYKIVWLLFIGPLFLFISVKFKILTTELKYILMISVSGYLLIALTYSGTLPRYAFIFMALSVFPLSYLLCSLKHSNVLKNQFKLFHLIYLFSGFFALILYASLK